jgi:antitoxin component YwqK of YwqJK toxin-antitoxin module
MTKKAHIIESRDLDEEVDGITYHYQVGGGPIPFTGISLRKPYRLSSGMTHRYEEEYKNGKQHGYSVSYYPRGKLASRSYYKNGEEEGLSENFYKNGQIEHKGKFKNGYEDGPQESFYENGQLKVRKNWKNRNLLSEEWFCKNGELEYSQMYYFKDGKRTDAKGKILNGLVEYFYENGQVKYRHRYKDGKYHGFFEHYKDNGQLWGEINYKDGEFSYNESAFWITNDTGFHSSYLPSQLKNPMVFEKVKEDILDSIHNGCNTWITDDLLDVDTPNSIRNDREIAECIADFGALDCTWYPTFFVYIGEALKADDGFMQGFCSWIKSELIRAVEWSEKNDIKKITEILHRIQILRNLDKRFKDKSFNTKVHDLCKSKVLIKGKLTKKAKVKIKRKLAMNALIRRELYS